MVVIIFVTLSTFILQIQKFAYMYVYIFWDKVYQKFYGWCHLFAQLSMPLDIII